MFVGVSPEFEFAFYSLHFLMTSGQEYVCLVKTGPYKMAVKAFPWKGAHGKIYIGSVFPEAAPLDEQEAATRIQTIARGKTTRNAINRR
jgi:hypothetical protein